MSTGFERLRVIAAAGLGGAALVPLVAGPAVAAQTNLPVWHTGHQTETHSGFFGHSGFHRASYWRIGNQVGWPTKSSSVGYGITSQGRSTFVTCSGVPCFGTGTGSFIFGVMPRIDGTVFRNPNGSIDATSARFKSDPALVHGVRTKVRHDFLGMDDHGNSIVRVLMTFSNTTSNKMKRTIQVGTQIAHQSVGITETSSGDQTYSRDDAWLMTENNSPTLQLFAKGDAQRSTIDADPSASGAGSMIDRYLLRLKPHKTVRLLYYVALSPALFNQEGRLRTIEHHFDDAFQLDAHGLLAGLTSKQRHQIINWRNVPTS